MTYWNIKIYEDRDERETIRGVSEIHKEIIMDVFDREGVQASAFEVKDDRSGHVSSESVNLELSFSKQNRQTEDKA